MLACDGKVVRDSNFKEQSFSHVVPVSEVIPLIATYAVEGEQFNVVTVDPIISRKLMDIWQEFSDPLIPIGRLHRGPGASDHNAPWSWHMNPLDLTENATEVCDGKPSDIENNLDYWIGTVKAFCPWAATLKDLRIWAES